MTIIVTDDAVEETKIRKRLQKFYNLQYKRDVKILHDCMRFYNKKIGILKEQFSDGTLRETRYQYFRNWGGDGPLPEINYGFP